MRTGFLRFLFAILFALGADVALADDPPNPPAPPPPPPAPPTHVTLTKKEYDDLMAGQKKADPPPTDPPATDPLRDKVKNEREAREKADADTKAIETIVSFNLGLDEFVKKNADLLPAEIPELVKAANAERYETASAKAAAIKKAVLECFFQVQANVDCLTESQKRELEDFKKLTKEGREAKAGVLYTQLFEPTLEMNRRVKKAEELARGNNGIQTTSGTEAAYREKMIAAAHKKFLGK